MRLLRAVDARSVLVLAWVALTPLALAGGKPSAAPAAPAAPAGNTFPRAQLRASEFTYSWLLFHPVAPKGDVAAGARKLMASKYPRLNASPGPGKPRAEAVVQAASDKDLDPIDEDSLTYFARTLTGEERKSLMGSRQATLLSFRVPFEQRNEVLLDATRFAHELATEHGAFLWDAETRQYFSPRSWKEARLDGWSGGVPFVPAHVTFHVYRAGDGDALRMISLGMGKLGLPDLVVEQVPQSLTQDMGRFANLVAQLLAEGLSPSADGTLEVDLAKLKDARLQKQLEARVQKGAARRVKLRALAGQRDGGDPDNVLMELGFPGSGDVHVRHVAALDAVFGPQADGIVPVAPGDPELEAVARKARARLIDLRARAERGLRPPEELVLKAGFRTDDGGTEFMWLEVTGWAAGKWRGTLANEPDNVSRLRVGSPVEMPEAEVVDYLYVSPEGKQEGGESSRILMRRGGQ
ncbi:DUF2314 domain-containing protein [Hyalangium versicolor]|uniref:DUF2314 domain-containing protein n=1 Tax=Hyalangium versicolor TaxID=2861190 RepID=UPI001CCF8386|nr:DUF2314 domain-containing protein [Hyalangium versicolor]